MCPVPKGDLGSSLDTINRNKSYILRTLATRRPSEAPQRRDGTNRPLGTETPYVQQLRKKYSTKNSERVTGLKVAVNKARTSREKERQRGLENRVVQSYIHLRKLQLDCYRPQYHRGWGLDIKWKSGLKQLWKQDKTFIVPHSVSQWGSHFFFTLQQCDFTLAKCLVVFSRSGSALQLIIFVSFILI